MLVGRTGSGKTVAWKALQNAWRQLKEEGLEGWQRVWVYIMNSLALSNDEIYGCTSKVFLNTHLSFSLSKKNLHPRP
jgi:dynein heavy chain